MHGGAGELWECRHGERGPHAIIMDAALFTRASSYVGRAVAFSDILAMTLINDLIFGHNRSIICYPARGHEKAHGRLQVLYWKINRNNRAGSYIE